MLTSATMLHSTSRFGLSNAKQNSQDRYLRSHCCCSHISSLSPLYCQWWQDRLQTLWSGRIPQGETKVIHLYSYLVRSSTVAEASCIVVLYHTSKYQVRSIMHHPEKRNGNNKTPSAYVRIRSILVHTHVVRLATETEDTSLSSPFFFRSHLVVTQIRGHKDGVPHKGEGCTSILWSIILRILYYKIILLGKCQKKVYMFTLSQNKVHI